MEVNKPCLFLYDFFPEIINKDIFPDQFYEDSGIIRCKTFEELEMHLY